MAKLPGTFNTKTVENRMGSFEAIPADEYAAKIKKAERLPTNANKRANGDNKRLIAQGPHRHSLVWEITEGKYKGRLVYQNLNLEHEKDNVREIAEGELATIVEACGKVSIEDTDEIVGIECTIKVGIQEATAANPRSNNIKNVKSLKGAKKPKIDYDDAEEEEEEQKPAKKSRKVSFN